MVGSLYLCINAVETKSLMFQFPLSIMNAERDAYIETFPEKDVDSEMLRRLQMRIIEAVLRIVNADDCEMVTLYPRNYYIIGSRGVETENGTSPDYIPICDAKLYTTNHVPTQVQIYFTHIHPLKIESAWKKIRVELGNEFIQNALELYMADHLERGAQF
jgi:hypothetical protein